MPGPGAACGGRRSQAGTQATAAAPRSRRSSRRRTRGRWPASSDAPSSARRHRHRCKICKFSRVAGPKTRGSLDAPTTARRHRHRLLARAGEQSAATWWGGATRLAPGWTPHSAHAADLFAPRLRVEGELHLLPRPLLELPASPIPIQHGRGRDRPRARGDAEARHIPRAPRHTRLANPNLRHGRLGGKEESVETAYRASVTRDPLRSSQIKETNISKSQRSPPPSTPAPEYCAESQ